MKKCLFIAVLVCSMTMAYSQKSALQPIGVGEKLGEINLRSLSGDTYNTSDLLGKKNIMLVFPRGMVVPNVWCPICYYQYEELARMEKELNIRAKFDLEILFVLPYPQDSLLLWQAAAGDGLAKIEKWKYPENYENLTGPVRDWADYTREFFPDTYNLKDGKLDISLPVLMDEDKTVSRSMALFTQEWGGTKVSQNMPTVFIIDKEGKLVFKYHSQYTNDRPSAKYLVEIMDKIF